MRNQSIRRGNRIICLDSFGIEIFSRSFTNNCDDVDDSFAVNLNLIKLPIVYD